MNQRTAQQRLVLADLATRLNDLRDELYLTREGGDSELREVAALLAKAQTGLEYAAHFNALDVPASKQDRWTPSVPVQGSLRDRQMAALAEVSDDDDDASN
tara:strand:- start:22485 stop:22787 length:303 start_codon:yes stop_codon:yes gene_type:complete